MRAFNGKEFTYPVNTTIRLLESWQGIGFREGVNYKQQRRLVKWETRIEGSRKFTIKQKVILRTAYCSAFRRQSCSTVAAGRASVVVIK